MIRKQFTVGNRKALCELLAAGNTVAAACRSVGIARPTFYGWLADAEKARDGSLKVQFAQEVEAALGAAEIRAQGLIQQAMNDDPKWAAWYLERRNPEEWGKRERHEVTGAEGGPLKVDLQWVAGPTPGQE